MRTPWLTEREMEVARLVARGLGNKEIAVEMMLSTSTIKSHISDCFDKLDVNSRVSLARWVWEQEIVTRHDTEDRID